MSSRARDYREHLDEVLKDDKEAVAYLNAALAEEDPEVFLAAVQAGEELLVRELSIDGREHDVSQGLPAAPSAAPKPPVRLFGNVLDLEVRRGRTIACRQHAAPRLVAGAPSPRPARSAATLRQRRRVQVDVRQAASPLSTRLGDRSLVAASALGVA